MFYNVHNIVLVLSSLEHDMYCFYAFYRASIILPNTGQVHTYMHLELLCGRHDSCIPYYLFFQVFFVCCFATVHKLITQVHLYTFKSKAVFAFSDGFAHIF